MKVRCLISLPIIAIALALTLVGCGGTSHPVSTANKIIPDKVTTAALAQARVVNQEAAGKSPQSSHPRAVKQTFAQTNFKAHKPGFGKPPAGDFGLSKNKKVGGIVTLYGYDAVTISNIPSGAQIVGCYTSGPYVNCGPARSDYPHAYIISIATYSGAVGKCLDTEPGDAVPSQDAAWLKWMKSLGVYEPCIYADSAEMGEVKADTSGISGVAYWLADWDGNPSIPAGFQIKQYQSDCCVDWDSAFNTLFFVPDPNYNPSFNLGYADGISGAYSKGYNADHRPKTVESGAFDVGFKAGYAHAKAAGHAYRHGIAKPTTYNTSYNWGFREGWAAGSGGTFQLWFGTLYATPSSRAGANTGYQIAFSKAFNGNYKSGFDANK